MRSRRRSYAGFTLFEALLSAAIVAMFAIPVLGAFSRSAAQDVTRIAQFEVHEFAVSLLEERVGIRDFTVASGVYADRFAYEVLTAPYETETQTRFDDLFKFTKLTIRAEQIGSELPPVEVSQIVARKAEP